MEKNEISFEDFLRDVDPAYHQFVNEAHDFLLNNDCKAKLELAKNGYVVSYAHTKSKRVLANYVFRKGGLVIRLYGDHVHRYLDFMGTLPEKMVAAIEKAPVCKRLIDPLTCNSRCPMGYDFTVKGRRYQKCRYNCFMFAVNDENIPSIRTFLAKEIAERAS